MAWTTTGTASVTNGSNVVYGASTTWASAKLARAGDIFKAPDGRDYEVASVQSNTQLTLMSNYLGSTASGQAYAIIHTGLLPAELAVGVSELQSKYLTTISQLYDWETSTADSVPITNPATGVTAQVKPLARFLASLGDGSLPGSFTTLSSATGLGISDTSQGSGAGFFLGNGDGASGTNANLRIKSWYGVGFATTMAGASIPSSENAVWINTRDGSVHARGGYRAVGVTAAANPNAGAESPFVGAKYEWFGSNASSVLWAAQAVQPVGYYYDASDLVFYSGSTERLRIRAPYADDQGDLYSALTLVGTFNSQSGGNATGAGGGISFSATSSRPMSMIKGLLSNTSSGADQGGMTFLTRPVGTGTTLTERMRLDVSGNLLVGTTSGSSHTITKLLNGEFGGIVDICSDGGSVAVFAGGTAVSQPSIVSACAFYLGKSTATGRSLAGTGTFNASGADYAEYECNNGLTIAKGSIVGFLPDGTLTLTFSNAIRFGIKSTNPSYVGGDTLGSEDVVGKRPEQPVRKMPVDTEPGDTDAEWAAKEAAYAAALEEFEAALEAERVKVDRIAYSGKVPVNVQGATPGGYIIAAAGSDGLIVGEFVAEIESFAQQRRCVGRVNRILDDGRAEVAVMVL